MYYNGVYTIKNAYLNGEVNSRTWRCDLEVKGYHTTGYGYSPRGAMSDANRAMNKVMKYKRICDAVKAACEPPEVEND